MAEPEAREALARPLAPIPAPPPAEIPARAWRALASFRGAQRLEQDYRSLAHVPTPEGFVGAALGRLGITTAVDAIDLQRVPDNGPLVIVSHLDLRAGCVVDPPWAASAVRLLRRAHAAVLPVHVAGRNSDAFQIAGVVHPLLRTLMLPGELANKRGARVAVRIGAPWTAARIAKDTVDASLGATLQLEVYALSAADAATRSASFMPGECEPLADPVDPARVESDVARLPPTCLLASCGNLDVYAAPGGLLPFLLAEIGRLREIAFRAAGEGEGRATDLDR